jgi:hypothetical protein
LYFFLGWIKWEWYCDWCYFWSRTRCSVRIVEEKISWGKKSGILHFVDSRIDCFSFNLSWQWICCQVGKESEMLSQEIHALERQSSHNARYIKEAVQLFEQNSYTELFQGNLRVFLFLCLFMFWRFPYNFMSYSELVLVQFIYDLYFNQAWDVPFSFLFVCIIL